MKVGDRFSAYVNTTCGIPQGSVLGPLLFSIFINDVFRVCSDMSIYGFADDLQLCLSRPLGLVEDLCVRINDDMKNISNWAESNKLKLNPAKSFVLPISKNVVPHSELPPISLLGMDIKFVDCVTNLGCKINTTLTCTNQISCIVSKVYSILRNLWRSSSFVPTEIKRKLVIQLILPIVTYSAVVYSQLDSRSSHKLLVCWNNVTRYVYGLKKFDHISAYSDKILGCGILKYLQARNCIFSIKLF